MQDFNYIVQAYCRGCARIKFIRRGKYEVIRAEDNQIIGPSELASMLELGVKLEMGIVMRQRTADEKKCPRCGHINLQVTADSGWIEWQVIPHLLHTDK
jgi:hypothetical protein